MLNRGPIQARLIRFSASTPFKDVTIQQPNRHRILSMTVQGRARFSSSTFCSSNTAADDRAPPSKKPKTDLQDRFQVAFELMVEADGRENDGLPCLISKSIPSTLLRTPTSSQDSIGLLGTPRPPRGMHSDFGHLDRLFKPRRQITGPTPTSMLATNWSSHARREITPLRPSIGPQNYWSTSHRRRNGENASTRSCSWTTWNSRSTGICFIARQKTSFILVMYVRFTLPRTSSLTLGVAREIRKQRRHERRRRRGRRYDY